MSTNNKPKRLKDLSIIISIFVDCDERIINLERTLQYLNHYFDVNIILSELGEEPKLSDIPNVKHIFHEYADLFNRQLGVNLGVKAADTPVIAHYDADILLHPKQITTAVKLIIDDKFDIVYPYDGKFYDVPEKYHSEISESNSLECINIDDCTLFNPYSVGGVVFFDREKFWEGGGANENFSGLGYEDNELNWRYNMLSYRIARLEKPLFHLTHPRGDTSWNHNPNGTSNQEEYVRIRSMTVHELEVEISKWPWNKEVNVI